MREKGDGKNQGSVLTIEKLVFSGNSHNPFKSAIAVACLGQGVRVVGFAQFNLALMYFFRVIP